MPVGRGAEGEHLSVSVTHFEEGKRVQKLEAGEKKAEKKLGDYKACD